MAINTSFIDVSTIKPSATVQRLVEKNPGPYIGTVVNNRDPERLGRLSVMIETKTNSSKGFENQEIICNYMSPFFGTKGEEFIKGGFQQDENNPNSYQGSRHSYGMWMVPPDIGTKVMVLFVEGDANQGFWFGGIPEPNSNFMTPGIAASTNTGVDAVGDFQLDKQALYGTEKLPAGEINTRILASSPGVINQPIHPFAETLRQEGLIQDTVRGTTTSSARRESPSQVFGISTPGRKDPGGKQQTIGSKESKVKEIVDRLTGHTFVMDDGDESGDNQLVRLRSSSGHQLLFNDTAGVVYLANGTGNVWLEFSANGAIDIYSGSSVNIRSSGDLNLHSDSDINMFARNQIKMRSLNKLVLDGGAIQQYADTDIQLHAAVGSITEKAPNGNLLSYAGSQQIHMAGGVHHLTGSQVHFNSIGSNSGLFKDLERTNATDTNPFGTGTRHVFIPDVNPMEKYQAGPLEVIQEGNVSMSGMRVPTHEPFPYHYDKVVSFVGFGPSLNDKVPGTAEFLAQRNRSSDNATIRVGQYQADLQAHLDSLGLGTDTGVNTWIKKKSTSNITKIQEAANEFTNAYNLKYGLPQNFLTPITAGVNDAIDQTVQAVTGKSVSRLKDQIFVKQSGTLYTIGNLSQKVNVNVSKVFENLSSLSGQQRTIGGILDDGVPDNALSFANIGSGNVAGGGQLRVDKAGLINAGLGILRTNSSTVRKIDRAVNTAWNVGGTVVKGVSLATGKSELEVLGKGIGVVQDTYKNLIGGKVTAMTQAKTLVSNIGTGITKAWGSVTGAIGRLFG
jgi:hypothetical protein